LAAEEKEPVLVLLLAFSCRVGVLVGTMPPVPVRVGGVSSRMSVVSVVSPVRVRVPEVVRRVLVVAVVVARVEVDVEEDLEVEVDEEGRSVLWKLSWNMGAKRLKAVMEALVSGTVWVPSGPGLLPSHVTVGTLVDVAIEVHVCPLMFAQP